MDDINLLISVVNRLRAKGLSLYAAQLDGLVRKYAQDAGFPPIGSEDPLGEMGGEDPAMDPAMDPAAQQQPVPQQPAPEPTPEQQGPEKPNEKNILQRTFFYQFEKWHNILDRELPKFDYLGKGNIDAIRSSLASVHGAFAHAFDKKPNEYDKSAVLKWNEHVNDLVRKMEESQKKKLNETKAVVDAHLLYGTTNRMLDSAKRIFGDDQAFSGVLKAFGDLVRVFSNVVKQTSEQIAQRDLTEVR